MMPSADNVVTVVIVPGKYEFGSIKFKVDTPYINLVSLTGNSDVILDGIDVISSDVYLRGINCVDETFNITDSITSLICESCVGGKYSFGGGKIVSGTFINCVGGEYSFGGTIPNPIIGQDDITGTLSSTVRLYGCRLTSGTFKTPEVGGKLSSCIDGSGDFIDTYLNKQISELISTDSTLSTSLSIETNRSISTDDSLKNLC